MAQIPPVSKHFHRLGLGCWVFDRRLWSLENETQLFATMQSALEHGINHFDTASGYGGGDSETTLGRFLQNRRERVFLASKANLAGSAEQMLERVQHSLERLQTSTIDLYYIHWPKTNTDMRPAVEGLERARQRGWIRAIGVSNFTVAQMEQVRQAGQINAHQLGYNLLWRHREPDVIRYCREQAIPIVTYSSIAQGILTGKFTRELHLPPGDQRNTVVYFQAEVWPSVYAAVEQWKELAYQVGRPLQHLAIRWVLQQPGITCALVGARSPAQVIENAAALEGEIDESIFRRMTEISDELAQHIPDTGDMYNYAP